MTEFFHSVFDTLVETSAWRLALQDTWMIALLVTALIWGRGPERFVISIWLVNHELSRYLRNYAEGLSQTSFVGWGGVKPFDLAGEVILLVGFVALALLANRQYILWIAAFQVIAVLAHGVMWTNDDLLPFVYFLLIYGAGWAQIFLMTGGQIAHVRRKKGVYADWLWQVKRPVRASTPARALS